MAFNVQTFKTRTLTAIVFVAVMGLGLFINHWSFLVLFSIVHFGAWREYQRLIEKIYHPYAERTPIHKYGIMVTGWAFMLWMCSNAYSIGSYNLHILGWTLFLVLILVLPIAEVLFTKNLNLRNTRYSLIGFVYISLMLGLLMNLRSGLDASDHNIFIDSGSDTETGLKLSLCLIFSLWVNDTMAYIVGSLIGRTPLSAISPKKTWEGTAGGILLCVAVIGFLFHKVLYPSIAPWIEGWTWYAVAGIASIAGTLGDLFESYLKRRAGVKDSGQLMPGHGGFLDRFDSLLLAIPFVVMFLLIVFE